MKTQKTVDFIIVGQGLAGSLLSFFLHQKGKSLLVVDSGEPRTSSKVAAGIINPVTGRRYVKSWRIDDLLPFAQTTYRALEELLQTPLFRSRPILRTLFTTGDENHWTARLGDPGYHDYLKPEAKPGRWTDFIHPVHAFGEVALGGQVNLKALLGGMRSWLAAHHALIEDTFEFDDMARTQEGIEYRGWKAGAIIFCEGYQSRKNPYFANLPYEGAKGEVLFIRLPEPQPEKMMRHHFFLIPMEDGTYWAGSNYIWRYDNDAPTPEGRTWLTGQLEKILRVPYEIIDHQAAVRPTVKDRRPLLGVHPDFKNVFLFNGLGTKGASQGPFFAHHMAQFLTEGTSLDPEVDIRRFHAKSR